MPDHLIDVLECGRQYGKYAHWYPFGKGVAQVALEMFRESVNTPEQKATLYQSLEIILYTIEWRERILFIPGARRAIDDWPVYSESDVREVGFLVRSMEKTVNHYRQLFDSGRGDEYHRASFRVGIEWACDAIRRKFRITSNDRPIPRFEDPYIVPLRYGP